MAEKSKEASLFIQENNLSEITAEKTPTEAFSLSTSVNSSTQNSDYNLFKNINKSGTINNLEPDTAYIIRYHEEFDDLKTDDAFVEFRTSLKGVDFDIESKDTFTQRLVWESPVVDNAGSNFLVELSREGDDSDGVKIQLPSNASSYREVSDRYAIKRIRLLEPTAIFHLHIYHGPLCIRSMILVQPHFTTLAYG